MKFLSDVDGDEISPVKRAANKRRFLMLKGGSDLDAELADILDVPWEREGALLDEIRKSGIQDETVERAVIAAVRLLKGVEGEFTPELVEKLGTELYSRKNPKLNTGKGTGSGGELCDSEGSEETLDSTASGAPKDGSGRDGELSGKGSAPKVAADNDDDEDDEDVKKSWIARKLSSTVGKSDESDNDDVMSTKDGGDAVEFRVPVKKEDGTWDYDGVPDEARGFFSTLIEKGEQTSKELADAREQLAKAAENNLHRDAVEKAASYSHVAPTDDLAPILKEAAEKLDPETIEKLEELLGNAEERIKKGDLFSEMGKRTTNDSADSDAYTEAVKKAAELVEKTDDPLSQDQALSRVWMANPDLYAKYLAENGMGV